MSTVISSAYADMGESQYKAAQMPNTKSCSVGRDLLSDEAEYDKTDIAGPLPYSRHYETTLSYNLNRVDDMTNGLKSIGGWTDNYNNYMLVAPAGDGVQAIMRLRLPGDKDDTYYIVNLNTQSVQRIFSPTPLVYETWYLAKGDGNAGNDKIGYMSTDHRDRKVINLSGSSITNLSFSVNNLGTIYDFQYKKSTADDGTAIYKMVRVTYPDGRRLGLSYETWGGAGLLAVADNRGHLLTFIRDFYADGWALRSVVKSVTLTAQNGYPAFPDQQTVTYQYQISDWANFKHNGDNEKFYTISSATSNLYGTETYTYTPAALSTAQLNGVVYSAPQYQVQVLNNVKNTLGATQLHWDYGGTPWTMLTDSHRPLSPKNAESVGRTSWGNGVIQGATFTSYASYSTDAKASGQTNSGQIASFGDSNTQYVTYQFSGYPCITYGKVPVSQEIIDIRWNNVSDIYDYNGNHTHFTYDGMNRVVMVEEAIGTAQARMTKYTYGNLNTGATNLYSTPTLIEEYYKNNAFQANLTQTTANILNARGQIIQQTKGYAQAGSSNQTWKYDYYDDSTPGSSGLLKSSSGPRSPQVDDSNWYTYDKFGNLTAHSVMVTNFSTGVTKGYTTTYSNYNSAGLAKTINNPDGTVDQIDYDEGYRIRTRSHGNSSSSIFIENNTYNALGQLKTSTDADGKTSFYEYDLIGRLVKTTQPNGNVEQNVYHPNGVVYYKQLLAPNGYLFESHWQDLDGNGRVSYTRSGSEDRLWTSMILDPNGNVTQTQTAQGIINKWGYDALNRANSHTDGNNHTDTKVYDDFDNQAHTFDSQGAGSNRTFINRKITSTEYNSDSGSKSYQYDLANNMTIRSHNERICNFGRSDQLGRNENLNCALASGSNPDLLVAEAYTYDQSANGNLDQVTSFVVGSSPVSGFKMGTDTSYTYDIYHRIKTKTQTNNTPAKWGYARSVLQNIYNYSSAGRLTNITYPSGNRIDYNYDGSGILNNIQLNNQYVVSNISFDGANRLRSFNWGGTQALFNIGIIESGLITSVGSTNSSGAYSFYTDYIYDLDGRLKSQEYLGARTAYEYDNASQLNNETLLNGSSIHYYYDNNGNRIGSRATGNTGLGYSTADHSYTGNHLTGWSKDGITQPLSLTGQGEIDGSYKGRAAYDYKGRRRTESGLPNSTQYIGMYFDYNHKNERTFRGGSYIDRQYMYDENSHLIGEYGPSGSMIVEYVWLDDRPIAAVYAGNRIVYLVTDYQKKPRRGIDATTQGVVWAWDPDAFGIQQASGSVQMNLRFPGQYYDEQSGLYYNHNRYYNPELGRYMEPDPIGLEGGLNPYSYVGNDPVNQIDPTGTMQVMLKTLVQLAVQVAKQDAKQIVKQEVKQEETQIVKQTIKPPAYRPSEGLPKDKNGNKVPSSDLPHTQIGSQEGRLGEYTQTREWGYGKDGKLEPTRDIDWTGHRLGQGAHENPHQHDYIPNPTGGTMQRSKEAKTVQIP
ncbi:RHS repeat-associated core domain-containing protein [Aquirhabdus sp.]|uniref:RHS repeat-associated core domain-containing protein n=1 Tax=Aquirhabdus sp. TaxID=2824160 RepID=UPI00396C8031